MNEMTRGRPAAEAATGEAGATRAIRFEGDVPRDRGPDRMPTRHVIHHETAAHFDPFLYLAHFGPEELHRTSWGFPPHPHRGFETVTYMLEGHLEHRDSVGAHAVLNPGDVQWMTAGGGIVHAEEPPEDFQKRGGPVHGFQIWLNLPRPLKMTAPGFQMLRAADMPVVEPAPGVTVRVIGGAVGGAASPVTTHSPVSILHVALAPGAAWNMPVEDGHGLFAYCFSGPLDGRLRLFDTEGTIAALEGATDAPTEWMVLGGERLQQPIAAYGPFVMSTREELVQAFEDYQSGRMGRVAER